MTATTPKEWYTSNEVVALCGCSLRNLQWWDQQGIVRVNIRGHFRQYYPEDVIAAGAFTKLRSLFSPSNARALMKEWRKARLRHCYAFVVDFRHTKTVHIEPLATFEDQLRRDRFRGSWLRIDLRALHERLYPPTQQPEEPSAGTLLPPPQGGPMEFGSL